MQFLVIERQVNFRRIPNDSKKKSLRKAAGIQNDFAFNSIHFPNMYNYQGKELYCSREEYYEVSTDNIHLTTYEFKKQIKNSNENKFNVLTLSFLPLSSIIFLLLCFT